MGAMVSQITSLMIVYSIFYSGTDKKKTSKPRVTDLCEWNSPVTGEFPAQSASNAKMFPFDDVISSGVCFAIDWLWIVGNFYLQTIIFITNIFIANIATTYSVPPKVGSGWQYACIYAWWRHQMKTFSE